MRGMSQALWVLALAALFSFAAAQRPATKLVVYFPFGLSNEVMETQGYKLQDEVTTALRAELSKDKAYSFATFSRAHPSVKRALAEGSLKSALLLEPYTGMSQGQHKAITLGKLIRGDLALAGVIDSFEYNETTKRAKLVGSIELFDLKSGKMIGSVALTAEGDGETEAAAAKSAAMKYAEIAAPQVISTLSAPTKKDGGSVH